MNEKGNEKIVEIINKLFNSKPNEQFVKSIMCDDFIPSEEITKNFIPNMSQTLHYYITKDLNDDNIKDIKIDLDAIKNNK